MALACEGAIEYRGGFRAYHDYRLTLRHYTKAEPTEGLKKNRDDARGAIVMEVGFSSIRAKNG